MKHAHLIRRGLPLLLLSLAGAGAPDAVKPAAVSAVRGDYVEVRTASVFAGACHYNGERVTEGRSAVLAWNIAGGSFDGVDLAGTKIIAAVRCDENLAETRAPRKSELTVDADTDTKAAAAVAWVKGRVAGQLGQIDVVRRGPVTFRHDSDAYVVTAAGLASMTVKPMPDAGCCNQPNLVWYAPLMEVDGRRVGFVETAAYASGRVGNAWTRTAENSAFYGTFAR